MKLHQRVILFLKLCFFYCFIHTIQAQDSTTVLPEVQVKAFEKKRSLLSSPDALARVDSGFLKISNGLSFSPVLNAVAGVRLEERSLGSYRVAIRGSALRSPFGVRNVKIYWNEIPLTDAGNNTYFQLFEPALFHEIIISKGPAGGMYGAGTGGVMLLYSPVYQQFSQVAHEELYNSLGGYKQTWDVRLKQGQATHRIFASYWNQEGYRVQSDLHKRFVSYAYARSFKTTGSLNFMAYYGHLNYQTPGGLTLAQYLTNPTQARPKAGTIQGAVEQQATFDIKSFFSALSIGNQWHENISWSWANALQINRIENPSIRNYEIRKEPNFSSRGVIHYKNKSNEMYSADVGYEFLTGQFDSQTFANNLGEKGNLQLEQNTSVRQLTVFLQHDFAFKNDWNITLSGSLNRMWTQLNANETIFSPRLALSKKIKNNHSLVAKIAQGFSPPSIGEIRPSSGDINPTLKAEKGWNYELSYRGKSTFGLSYNLTLYQFDLAETIALRRTADGADYFVNVGRTLQKGLELELNYQYKALFTVHTATSWQNYRFKDYTSVTNNYSGNFLTGTSPFIQSVYANVSITKKLVLIPQFIFTDKIYLNDANTDILPASRLWNTKVQYGFSVKKLQGHLWASVDNIGNERYSAGPDLNAVGLRYYNAAAGRNFSVGLRVAL